VVFSSRVPCDFAIYYEGIPFVRPSRPRPKTFSTRRHLIEATMTSMLLENASNIRTIDGTVRGLQTRAPNEIGTVSIRTLDNKNEELNDVALVVGMLVNVSLVSSIHHTSLRLHGPHSSRAEVACRSGLQNSRGHSNTIRPTCPICDHVLSHG
jgi:hypothetical protein